MLRTRRANTLLSCQEPTELRPYCHVKNLRSWHLTVNVKNLRSWHLTVMSRTYRGDTLLSTQYQRRTELTPDCQCQEPTELTPYCLHNVNMIPSLQWDLNNAYNSTYLDSRSADRPTSTAVWSANRLTSAVIWLTNQLADFQLPIHRPLLLLYNLPTDRLTSAVV
jgi:hypothetical protein